MNYSLQLKNLHYRVTSNQQQLAILKGCELCVEPGEKLAIIGRSGAGKSTLLALMAGLDQPTAGEVWLLGQNLSQLSENKLAELRALQVGFVFQNFQLMHAMTALENVMMPLELFGVADAKNLALEALEAVDLSDRSQHNALSLSGGEQQRVAIARALVTKPKILFADEPTGNLDETTGSKIEDLLLNLAADTSLILVTHDNNFAAKCDRQLNLANGILQENA